MTTALRTDATAQQLDNLTDTLAVLTSLVDVTEHDLLMPELDETLRTANSEIIDIFQHAPSGHQMGTIARLLRHQARTALFITERAESDNWSMDKIVFEVNALVQDINFILAL